MKILYFLYGIFFTVSFMFIYPQVITIFVYYFIDNGYNCTQLGTLLHLWSRHPMYFYIRILLILINVIIIIIKIRKLKVFNYE